MKISVSRNKTRGFLLTGFILIAVVIPVFLLRSIQKPAALLETGVPEKLAFYYGFPSQVNESGGDIEKATSVFKDYDMVVFGNTLDSPSNQDHASSQMIIDKLKKYGTRIYGYIDLCYDGGNYCTSLPLSDIYASIDRWKSMGAVGIFFDQVGYEYSVSRDRLNASLDYVHSQGLSAFINVWDPDDAFSEAVHERFNPYGKPPHLGPEDYFLHESFAVMLNQYQDPTFLINKSEKALKWKKLYGTKMVTVNTTAFSNPPFEQEKADYVWWMTLLYGFDGMAWGETGIYSADCQCLPFRSRPKPGDIGSPIEPIKLVYQGSILQRYTTAGVIEVDTNSHTGRFIPGALPASPIVDNFFAQEGSSDADLIFGNAAFLLSSAQLNLTVQSNGLPIQTYRVYLDSDSDPATGYLADEHYRIGADYMLENGMLYRNRSYDQHKEDWREVEAVSTSGFGSNRIQIRLPFKLIDYVQGNNLVVLVEHRDASGGEVVSRLPNSSDKWVIQSAPKRADNVNTQQSTKVSDLTYGSVIFQANQIVFTLRSKESFIDSYRIYLDRDANSTSGYLHPDNTLVGVDYMIEGNQLYRFTGAGQSSWSWSEAGLVDLTGRGSGEIQVSLDYDLIGYAPGENLVILTENLNVSDLTNLDLLPRFPEAWLVEFEPKDVVVYNSNEVSQTPDRATDLISGSVAFGDDGMTFTIQSNRDPIDSYRIFLDMDSDIQTGFTHFRNVNAGNEFLVENGVLYRFTGTDPLQWSWPEVEQVIESGVGTTQVQVILAYDQIGYVPGTRIGILMESMDPSWVTYDLVPRSPGMWIVP